MTNKVVQSHRFSEIANKPESETVIGQQNCHHEREYETLKYKITFRDDEYCRWSFLETTQCGWHVVLCALCDDRYWFLEGLTRIAYASLFHPKKERLYQMWY